nr:retrovirus-related Pol polyprotein from transposon TNT 1-94 [Tanacetum cinerariifolium]
MRTRRFFQKTSRNVTINGNDTAGYDKPKVECFNCHKLRHFERECRQLSNQDSRNWNQDSSRRTVNVEDTSSNAMVALDGAGFDWSFMTDDEVPTNMALMAFSDSKGLGYESYHAIPPPPTGLFLRPKLDLSNSGLEDFKQPKFESYRPKSCEIEFKNAMVEKKVVIPTIAKIEFVRAKQQENPARKPVKYAKMYRPRPVNTVRPNSAVVNVVRINQVNVIKASTCWVWRPTKPNGASITLKDIITFIVIHKKKINAMLTVDAQGKGEELLVKEFLKLATLDEPMLWHRRLGHINFKNINKLVKDNFMRVLPSKRFENDQTYGACLKGKQHKASSTKDETTCIVKKFITEIENLVEKKVKVIRCDNGTEFKNSVMNDFCIMKGIRREFRVARTLQKNGVAKRRNKTLIEAARTMLADSKLPTIFWAEVVNTACYVQNRVLVVKHHNKTPYELFRGRTPALSFMRPFGCHVTILNTLDHLGKFNGKSDDGFFIGYSLNSKAFRVYNLRTRKVEENFHIRFLEDKPVIAGKNSNDFVDGLLFDSSSKNASNDKPQPSSDAGHKDDKGVNLSNISNTYLVPSTPNTRIHKDHLLDRMIGDVQSGVLTRRMTKTINNQGFISAVYERKTHEDLHTCLFACFLSQEEPKKVWTLVYHMAKGPLGYTQEEGIDYDEVFAPVAKIKEIRLFLAYASFKDFIVYQTDVKSAFLYSKIKKEVYVYQPLGFEDPEFPDKVYKVEKALYGLHQAPRACAKTTAWNEFSSVMASAIIYLATNQKFNFSKYIFDHMVKNLEDGVNFLMFLRFVQVFLDSQVKGMLKHKEIYVTPSHSKKIFANINRKGKDFSGKVTPLFETMLVQPQEDMGEDSEIPTNSHHTLTVTQPSTSSQPQQKHKSKKSKKRITEVPQLSDSTHDVTDKHVTTTSNDSLLSDEDRQKLTELMELCTQLQSIVLALETIKANQALEIGSLKRMVKNLEKKASKKTHKLKRLYKIGSSTRVESFKDAGFALVDETQGRNDQDMFDTSILNNEEVVAKKEVSTADPVPTAGEVVTTVGVKVSTTAITSQISMDKITLAKALIDIKTSGPKAKGIVMQEPSETPTPTPIDSSQQPLKAKDKGKAKMIKLEKPLKRKGPIMIDEEVSRHLQAQLQAELEEEERIARQKEEEANIAVIESWDNTQEMMEANYQMAQQLQTEEQEQVNTFVDMDTELVKGSEKVAEDSSKRARGKLEQENSNRQRIEEENESAELKRFLEIILDDEDDVTIEDTTISSRYLTIVDYKIYKEGRKAFSKSSKRMVTYNRSRFGIITSTTRTPQQNGVVERLATTCHSQNRSLIHTRYNKTQYDLLRDRKPELKYLHIFGALCYPTKDFEDLRKLQPKADIRIFIGYSPSKKVYRIYNKRTRQTMETMNVQFNEPTQMAFEQHGSGPDLLGLTSRQINSGLVLNQAASTSAKPPTKNDLDLLFQLMIDEYFKSPSVVSTLISTATLLPPDTARASSSTTIDQEAPSSSTLPNIEAINSPINSTNVKTNKEVAVSDSDTFTNPFAPSNTSSSRRITKKQWKNLVGSKPYKRKYMNLSGLKYRIFKMDVKTAFLNGILKEEVYVSQPEGFFNQDHPNHVFRLKKALYGLKKLLTHGHSKLDEDPNGTLVDPTCYRGIIRSLMYLTTNCPDLVFFVCMCAWYQAKPIEKHLTAVKRVFRYLKGTINMCLWTKHIIVRYHFIKEQVENEVVKLYFIKIGYQLADIFTKALARERFKFLIKCLGIQSITPEERKRLAESDEK